MSRSFARLGKVQLQIMQILWRRGGATAREVTDELSRSAPVAHSTVQTLLRKLEAKGAVRHEVQDRTFVFHPVFAETEVATTAIHDLLSRVFHGSAYGLVSHLLQHESISAEELKRLQDLIERESAR